MRWRVASAVVALLAAGALPGVVRATEPLVTMGGDGAVFLSTGTSVRYDDNIFLSSTKAESDTIATLSPVLRAEFGRPDANNARVVFREDFLLFAGHSSENHSLGSLELGAGLPGGRSNLQFSSRLEQLRQNTRDVRETGSLVRRDHAQAAVKAEYELSSRTSFSGGLSFDRDDFKDPRLRDDREYALPVNLYYAVAPKMDVSAGYRLRQTNQPGFADARSDEQFFNVGARGELTPAIAGTIQVGALSHRQSGGPSQRGLGLDGALTWAASPGSRYTLLLSRDFRTSNATGEVMETSAVGVRARYELREFWSAEAGVRYETASYTRGRSDDFMTLELLFQYSPSSFVIFSGGCVLETNRSNVAPAEFDRNVLSFSAGFRY